MRQFLLCTLALSISAMATAHAGETANRHALASRPPLGWNSWDAYGLTIDEPAFRENAAVLASFRRYGWQYAVIDEGWYMDDPFANGLEARHYQLDGNGILIPAVRHFPSAAHGAGFKPLAAWVHSLGLKFGMHLLRGIPKQAVHDQLPIANSHFTAADAADIADVCPWDDGNYGIRDTAAGQAYYDAMIRRYADWGVDFLKVDCIADHPYVAHEIRQIALAIRKTGRPIVLSVSPGPANMAHVAELARYTQMWRISNDMWDGWTFTPLKADDDFPKGLESAFDNLAHWHEYARPGQWPDADMLPFGSLTPHPGWGPPRQSRLTADEERTQFALWAIARSPLILGGNLTQLDPVTRELMSRQDLLDLNQRAIDARPLTTLPAEFDHLRAWRCSLGSGPRKGRYLALFNIADQPVKFHASWQQLGFGPGMQASVELWAGSHGHAADVDVGLPAHGSAIYRLP